MHDLHWGQSPRGVRLASDFSYTEEAKLASIGSAILRLNNALARAKLSKISNLEHPSRNFRFDATVSMRSLARQESYITLNCDMRYYHAHGNYPDETATSNNTHVRTSYAGVFIHISHVSRHRNPGAHDHNVGHDVVCVRTTQ